MALLRRRLRTLRSVGPLSVSLGDTETILECTVPRRLSGAQVSTNYLCIRIVIAYLNGPYSCPCPNVKNSGRFFANRCIKELVAHCYAYHLMCQVEAVQFALQTLSTDNMYVQIGGVLRHSAICNLRMIE